jgi:CRISPR/Cas system-associated exonuclease Cas4 (RecB family)
MSYKRIRASEIATYVYCRRAWWLRQAQGYAPENVRELAAGRRYHEAHGRSVQKSFWLRRMAYVLLFVVVFFITFQILMGL